MFDMGDIYSVCSPKQGDRERAAGIVLEPGGVMLQAVYTYLDWRLMKGRVAGKDLRTLPRYAAHADRRPRKGREEGALNMGMRERDILTRLGMVKGRRRYYGERKGTPFPGTKEGQPENGREMLPGQGGGIDSSWARSWAGIKVASLSPAPSRRRRWVRPRRPLTGSRADTFLLANRGRRALPDTSQDTDAGRREGGGGGRRPSIPPPGELCPNRRKGRREAGRLGMEANGCLIPLRWEKQRKREIKAGISWEGRSRVGEGKWRTKEGRTYLSAADGKALLSCRSADPATSHGHTGVSEVIWFSEGAFCCPVAPTSLPSPTPGWTVSTWRGR